MLILLLFFVGRQDGRQDATGAGGKREAWGRQSRDSWIVVNSLFSQINTNTTDQEEINGILKVVL